VYCRRVRDPNRVALLAISAPALVSIMGRPGRFRDATRFKSYAGLAPRACETGDTDSKGQPMSKAGPSPWRRRRRSRSPR
jgi:transposase